MEKTVKQVACAHCQKKINLILYQLKSPTSNDLFFVCENCYNELTQEPPLDIDDRYYQYIEDKRMEEE